MAKCYKYYLCIVTGSLYKWVECIEYPYEVNVDDVILYLDDKYFVKKKEYDFNSKYINLYIEKNNT